MTHTLKRRLAIPTVQLDVAQGGLALHLDHGIYSPCAAIRSAVGIARVECGALRGEAAFAVEKCGAYRVD